MLQERLQQEGRYTVDLEPTTPSTVLDRCQVSKARGFQQLVVTPTHLDPRQLPDWAMMAAARYVGLHRNVEGRTRLIGAHIHTLLGDHNRQGDILEAPITTPNGYLSEWFAALSYAPHITNGTVSSPGGVYTGTFQYVTRKQAWETLRTAFGVEWRVAPNAAGALTFDVGLPSDLWGVTPSLVVLRNAGAGGHDRTLTGIEGTGRLTTDLEDFASKVILLHKDPAPPEGVTDPPPLVTIAVGDNPYTSPAGGPLVMDKLIDRSSQIIPNPVQVANAELTAVNQPRYELSVTTEVPDLGRYTQVGAPIYVYDPLGAAVDSGNPVEFRGGTIFPIRVRVTGMTTPLREGMGVYLRRAPDPPYAPEWTDLTPYVQWETGNASIDVGAVPRTIR